MAKSFLDQIRAAVNESGMSRYAICKELGIDQAVMSRFMSGGAGMSVDVLGRLADFLKLDVKVRKGK